MSFREKSAWISFLTLLPVSAIYFWRVGQTIAGHSRPPITLFFLMVGTLVVAEVVLHVLIAARSPKEARAPRDERERLIDLKATRVAFAVLLFGAMGSVGTIHLGFGTWRMSQATLFAVAVAELTKFGSRIVLYRRDA